MGLDLMEEALEKAQRELRIPDKNQNLGGIILAYTAVGAIVINLALIGVVIRGPGNDYVDRTQKTRQIKNTPAPNFPVDRLLESRKSSGSHYGRFHRGRR